MHANQARVIAREYQDEVRNSVNGDVDKCLDDAIRGIRAVARDGRFHLGFDAHLDRQGSSHAQARALAQGLIERLEDWGYKVSVGEIKHHPKGWHCWIYISWIPEERKSN